MNYKNEKYLVTPFKKYSEYTQSERNILPPLPAGYENQKDPPFMWLGDRWDYIFRD